jgi:hypothetical protein
MSISDDEDLDWDKMHSLVRENKIAELENYKEHLAKTDEHQENLFHSAAYGGNEETCTYLFDNGLKDIDRKNRWRTFPIQIACARNNSRALKFLLHKEANINVKIEENGLYGGYGYGKYLYGGNGINGGGYGGGGGDNLLHICVRTEASACLLILFPFCQHLIDVKNSPGGQTPQEIAPKFWDNAIETIQLCNAAVRELVSQHLINDGAGIVVAYVNWAWALCADSKEEKRGKDEDERRARALEGLSIKGKTLKAGEVARISNCMAFITSKSNRKLAEVLAMGLTEVAGLHGNDKEPEENSLDDNSTLEGKAPTPKVAKRKAPEPAEADGEADQESANEEEPQLQQKVKKQPAKKQHAKKKTRC